MEIPEHMEALAKPLGKEPVLPDVFLGELQQFGWGLQKCVLGNGHPGIRLMIVPGLLPFVKLSLPFHPTGLEKLRDDINAALDEWKEAEEIL